jgi:hypothetical protein
MTKKGKPGSIVIAQILQKTAVPLPILAHLDPELQKDLATGELLQL